MDTKEQIVAAIADALQPLIHAHKIQVRSDHGCWELYCRHHKNSRKLFECTLDEKNDSVYIIYNEQYDNTREEVLSDPAWLDRFFQEVQQQLGYSS